MGSIPVRVTNKKAPKHRFGVFLFLSLTESEPDSFAMQNYPWHAVRQISLSHKRHPHARVLIPVRVTSGKLPLPIIGGVHRYAKLNTAVVWFGFISDRFTKNPDCFGNETVRILFFASALKSSRACLSVPAWDWFSHVIVPAEHVVCLSPHHSYLFFAEGDRPRQ